MHIHTIAAFAFLFWRLEAPGEWQLLRSGQVVETLAVVCGQFLLLTLLAYVSTRKTRRMLAATGRIPGPAARFHHRTMTTLRLALVLGFGVTVLLTPWPEWFSLRRVAPALQIVGDLAALAPYLFGAIALWVISYPVERTLHGADDYAFTGSESTQWRLTTFLDFHIRHHLLVIAAPMILILMAANLTRGYDDALRRWSGSHWAPDILLGLAAGFVFVISPFLLRRVWRTEPLQSGPLRDTLTAVCSRVGLRCREILVWKSDGLMINAAVMGVVPWARYVLLSDALLASMTPQQVEAVFGHEAGHVRHRHMQHFLVFALVGWLAAGVATEGFSWWFNRTGQMTLATITMIQGIGLAFTFTFWMVGFGWLSRRFERQADLFGARCVTPSAAECHLPCSVHLPDVGTKVNQDRVCATGAAVFASALDRVATLSGIGHDEPSWRHSSVGNRIRFLASAAGDPNRALGFERLVRRAKTVMMISAVVGSLGAAYYWQVVRPVRVIIPGESRHVQRLVEPRESESNPR